MFPLQGLSTPLVIDPTGLYFRREGHGNNFIGGMSPPTPDQVKLNLASQHHVSYDKTMAKIQVYCCTLGQNKQLF